ncbi:MAG: hypothetical protein IJ544_00785 [Prevotella sp.]|nr:hypothetical protein [Prevotella sp.]
MNMVAKGRILLLMMVLLMGAGQVSAGSMDDIRQALEHGSQTQVQEKVFVHTDNECYFVGDTLWYKAYVVRADNMQPTDMSRILYVELLSPDGLLVERQQVVVSGKGYTCGQFELRDSLYSGYYELRAYTRWMLNFNVREHRYSTHDTWHFYNKQMAADYFRLWDGLYSRVLPIYSKPEEAGNYDARRMYQRPKTRLPQKKKDDLIVTFYPEGGHLVQGVENRVAFDVVDQHGEAINIRGTVDAGGQTLDIKTDYMGRGSFVVTPADKRLKAHFTFRGKNYTADLPKAETQGMAIRLEGDRLSISATGLPQDKEYGVSVLSGGTLRWFSNLSLVTHHLSLPLDSLPTGVNDLTIFDSDGRIWADRLFFVNHHEYERNLIASPIVPTQTYAPYERIEVPVTLPGITEPTVFSLSIHDRNTDEPSYDDGNLMTSMLLSSELRGFIARPAYYFEQDDEQHRRHLDLLMMVQGWRKYKWQELSDTARTMRYQPETTLTIEGAVYKTLGINDVEPDEVSSWQDGVGMLARKANLDEETNDPFADEPADDGLAEVGTATTSTSDYAETIEYGDIGSANDHVGVNHGNLRREVLVEAEISVGGQFAGSIQKTEHGRFLFQIPPFYGTAYLNMKAYKENDSIKKNMASHQDAKVLDEDAWPDFYVKRDLFFPALCRDYDYYEKHQPDYDAEMLIDTVSEFSMENDVHELSNVTVKGRRRGRRAIDWRKPAYVVDAYDLYNEMTDRGLSFGKLDMRQFPVQVCRLLYGNMNRYNSFRVDGRIDGATYYRNYSPLTGNSEAEAAGLFRANRTSQSVYRNLKLKRLQDIRVFSDYEPRTEDSTMFESHYSADATVELVTIPDDGVQPSFRDRHIVLQGINAPEQFYQPDYSNRAADALPADYRRTLYWNPNAVTDEQGRFVAEFYNNGKETRIKMTAAGVTGDGRLLYSK